MREGARDQLDQAVQQNLEGLLGLAIRLTGNQHAAEELVQETLLKAVRNWSGYRGDSNPKTWLFSIAINAFRDQLRTGKQPLEPFKELESGTSGPEQNSMAAELGQEIAQHVSALPPRQREVLVLLTWELMSVEETSEILDITPANVHATLHQARKTLKQKLKHYLDPDPELR